MPGDTGEVGHILVVDDDAMVRQTITNYLEEIARSLQRERGWLIAPFEFFQEIFGLREKRVLAHYPNDRVRRSS
jgi:hypothetical protein